MKYIFVILVTIMMLYTNSSFAGKINDMVNRERLRRDRIVKEGVKKNNNFEKYKRISKKKMHDYQEIVRGIKNKHVRKSQSRGLVKPAPQAVIFVSFSMPSLSLQQIIRDASRYEVPVVIRGLYENSFRKTMEKIFDLVKEDNKGGILINPLWFRKYGIKTVPAVVVNYYSEQSNIDNKRDNFDVVYGNIPLKRALKIVAERGSASKVVGDILSRGGV